MSTEKPKATRYKLVEEENCTLLLRDDGESICFLVLDSQEWNLWAEYGNLNMPAPTWVIADQLMKERQNV